MMQSSSLRSTCFIVGFLGLSGILVALHDQTLLEVLQQIVHIDKSQVLLSFSELFAEVFLKVLYSGDIVADIVRLVDFLSLGKVSLELEVEGALVLLQVNLPPVEVLELEVGDVVDLDERLEVLVQVVVVFLAQLFTAEVCNLSHGLDQGRAGAWVHLLLVEAYQVLDDHVRLLLRKVLARGQKLGDLGSEREVQTLVDHIERKVLHAKPNETKAKRFFIEAELLLALCHSIEAHPDLFLYLVRHKGLWVLQHVIN